MTAPDDYIDEIFGSFDHLTQEQKNSRLYTMVDNLCYAEVRELARCGAQIDTQLLPWALRRTEDAAMAHLLLDLGASAEKTRWRDLRRVSDEGEENGFDVLLRACKAGLPLEERTRACVHAREVLRPDVAEKLIAQESDIRAFTWTLERNDWRGLFSKLDWDEKIEKLCQEQKEERKALYDAHFSGGMTLEKLRETVTPEGMTGFMLAVQAERFIKVVHFMAHYPGQAARADDFMTEDRGGNFVALSLMARGQQRPRLLLLPALWYRKPAELATIIGDFMVPFVMNQQESEALLNRCRQMNLKMLQAKLPRLWRGPESGAP